MADTIKIRVTPIVNKINVRVKEGGIKGDDGITPIKGVDYFDGVDGVDGYTPIKNTDYFDGATGTQGIQGIQGLKGDTGDQGIQGEQGLKGDTGDQGIQGEQGLKGDTGDQGIQGIQGIQGEPGTTDHLLLTNIGVNSHADIDTALTRLANTSGTNTGDNAVNTLYSSLVSNATHTGEVTGATSLTIASDVVDRDNLHVSLKTRITNATTTGTYNLDHNAGNDWKLTLTGITTIDESNLPTGTDTLEFTLKVTGDFGLTVPTYWTVLGDTYDGTIWNFFTVQIHKGDATQEATCFISNF